MSSKPWIKTMVVCAVLALVGCAHMPGSGVPEEEFGRAVALLQDERYEDAVAVLEPLAERRPDNASVGINLAIAHRELGDDEAAKKRLEKVLARNPEHPEAHNLYAIQLRRLGQFDDARTAYQRVLELAPEHRHAHLNLAILCDIYLHDLECAQTYYDRYLTLSNKEDNEVLRWVADLERRRSGGKP
ncbi:tetratricopeptide repeat protein [Alkalilimnicola ehrlichii]|nr:tetratricopeptide repeat protein [Alkalilimnicola ehrlichii]